MASQADKGAAFASSAPKVLTVSGSGARGEARSISARDRCAAVTVRFKAVGGAAELPEERMKVRVRSRADWLHAKELAKRLTNRGLYAGVQQAHGPTVVGAVCVREV